MLMNLEPPLTVLVAFFMLGDAFTGLQLAGMALVVSLDRGAAQRVS